jgi:hypothetical protein
MRRVPKGIATGKECGLKAPTVNRNCETSASCRDGSLYAHGKEIWKRPKAWEEIES